ncbi:MAG: hypothetical protein ACXVO9_11895, partial [Bacteroidia bacterium]
NHFSGVVKKDCSVVAFNQVSLQKLRHIAVVEGVLQKLVRIILAVNSTLNADPVQGINGIISNLIHCISK